MLLTDGRLFPTLQRALDILLLMCVPRARHENMSASLFATLKGSEEAADTQTKEF